MAAINPYYRVLVLYSCLSVVASSFVISGGQIFTPGLAVLDAPQPGTPLGGELLEVALDVTANGRLGLPPYPDGSPTQLHNITIFLSSYDTGRNLTISDGGGGESSSSSSSSAALTGVGDIMASEPGSTVKHVKWVWPDCLVGDGPPPETSSSDRGTYNISIRQNFQLNGQPHYTIFDVPISVTNRIDESNSQQKQQQQRPLCDAIDNPLLTPEEIDAESANGGVGILFAPGDATEVHVTTGEENDDDDDNDDPGSEIGLGEEDGGGDGDQEKIGLGKEEESSAVRLRLGIGTGTGYLGRLTLTAATTTTTICMCFWSLFFSFLALVA